MIKSVLVLDFKLLFREINRDISVKLNCDGRVDEFCRFINQSTAEIEREFHALCNGVRRIMDNPNGELDRHRQGACIIIAFINRLNIPADCEKYREQVAVKAGFMVMSALLRAEAARPNSDISDKLTVAFLDKNGGFKFPPPLCERDKYIDTLILGLRKTFTGLRGIYERVALDENDNANDFDAHGIFMVPLIANILFHIESHTRNSAGIATTR
jgi:hypothetical protein